MATAKITFKFSDDNGDPSGGSSSSDNTGYRVYRKAGSDPSNDSANLLYENTSPPQGTGVITFIDDGSNGTAPSVNTRYYYRIENVRGTDTALSASIGPIVVADLDKLAYPENSPSNTDGVTNFINVEPLIHYDAFNEEKRNGIGYKYPNNSYVRNLSRRFSGLDQSWGGGTVALGHDGQTPEMRNHEDNPLTTGLTLGNRSWGLFSSQIRDAIGYDQDVEPRLVLDKGACFFYVFPSVGSHPDNTGNAHLASANQWSRGDIFKSYYSGRSPWMDKNAPLKIHKSIKYSDGGLWVDPDPPYGQANPNDLGWYPYYTYSGRTQTNLYFGFYPNGGYGISSPFHGGTDGGYYELNDGTTGKYTQMPWSQYPDLYRGYNTGFTDVKINVLCRRIYPNGSYDFFINGVKAATNVGNHKTLLKKSRTTSGHDSVTNSWWADQGLLQDLDGSGYAEDLHMITPPALGLNATKNSNHYGITWDSGFTTISRATHTFNEALLIPDDLTADGNADFNRMISYINTKYGASPQFATQGNYS